MEERRLTKSPISSLLPKCAFLELLFVVPGIICLVTVEEIGIPLGIGLIIFGGLLGGLTLVNGLRRMPCPECSEACRLDQKTQQRICQRCEIAWVYRSDEANAAQD